MSAAEATEPSFVEEDKTAENGDWSLQHPTTSAILPEKLDDPSMVSQILFRLAITTNPAVSAITRKVEEVLKGASWVVDKKPKLLKGVEALLLYRH